MTKPYLTAKDFRIVQCIHEGMGNQAIAEELGMAMRTVKAHKMRIFNRFGIDSKWDKSVRLVWLLSGGRDDTRSAVQVR